MDVHHQLQIRQMQINLNTIASRKMNMYQKLSHRLSCLTLAGALTFAAAAVSAQGMDADPSATKIDTEIRQELEARLKEITADDHAHDIAIEEGRARTVLCKTCHGADGKSVREGTPNLAAQNPAYIVDQFERFKDGRRNDFLMTNLAQTFNKEDMLKIALFYSDLPEQTFGGGKTELIPLGKEIFAERCASCHGENGRSDEGYARLAGQRPDYVVKMLNEFKMQSGKRVNPWMTGVALSLSQRDMEAIAAYLANKD